MRLEWCLYFHVWTVNAIEEWDAGHYVGSKRRKDLGFLWQTKCSRKCILVVGWEREAVSVQFSIFCWSIQTHNTYIEVRIDKWCPMTKTFGPKATGLIKGSSRSIRRHVVLAKYNNAVVALSFMVQCDIMQPHMKDKQTLLVPFSVTSSPPTNRVRSKQIPLQDFLG